MFARPVGGRLVLSVLRDGAGGRVRLLYSAGSSAGTGTITANGAGAGAPAIPARAPSPITASASSIVQRSGRSSLPSVHPLSETTGLVGEGRLGVVVVLLM